MSASNKNPQLRLTTARSEPIRADEIEIRELEIPPNDEIGRRLFALSQVATECPTAQLSAMCSVLDGALRQAVTVAKSAKRVRIVPPPQRHLTISTCARLFEISERTIRRWISDGDLEIVRRRERIFVDCLDVEKLRKYPRHDLA